MGVAGPGERSTICGEGCAMSDVSMALASYGAAIAGAVPTPQTLNAWLEANNGYECADGDCNNLVLSAISRLNSSFVLLGEPQKVRCRSYGGVRQWLLFCRVDGTLHSERRPFQ
jgi:hypothetical protein